MKAGKGRQPSQASLDSFFLSETGTSSLDLPLPALKDVSPAKPVPLPEWLVVARENLSEKAVKEKALLHRALADNQGESKPIRGKSQRQAALD